MSIPRQRRRSRRAPADDTRTPHGRLLLLGILLVAAALRAAMLWSWSHTPYFDVPLLDEAIYHNWAAQIATGSYHSSSAYVFAPLPACVIATLYKLLSPNLLYVRIMNLCFGVTTCYLIYLIAKSLADHRTGLLAGLLAALYKPFMFYSIVPLKTALAVLLFALTIYLFLVVVKQATPATALPLGLAAGGLLATRENAGILLPLMPALIGWLARRDGVPWRRLAATGVCYVIGLAVVLLPFMLRNYQIAGDFALTTHQAGFNLYLGNNLDNPGPYSRPAPFAFSGPYEQGVQFTIEASRRVGRTLSPGESSAYWMQEVMQAAWTQPTAFLGKLGQKTLALANRFEAGDHYDLEFLSRFVPWLRWPWPEFWWMFPLGVAGLVAALPASRPAQCVGLCGLAYAATLVVFYTTDRYRLPLLTVGIPFAAVGLIKLRAWLMQRRWDRLGIYAACLALALAVEHFPIQASDDRTAYYNLHAAILMSKGLEQEAVTYWEASAAMEKPLSAFAYLALADKALGKQELQKAQAYLAKVSDHSFAAAKKYEALGDSFLLQARPDQAIEAYRRSIAVNAGRLGPRRKLIRLYERSDPPLAARESEELGRIAAFYRGQ